MPRGYAAETAPPTQQVHTVFISSSTAEAAQVRQSTVKNNSSSGREVLFEINIKGMLLWYWFL